MESAEATLRNRFVYVFHTKVVKIFKQDDRWYVHLEGSRESISLGPDKPTWKSGDRVKVSMENLI